MKLIKYLNDHFITKQDLLEITKVTEADFSKFQENRVMPKCSYRLNLNLRSDSFLGLHTNEEEIEYYAIGYSSWLALIQTLASTEAIYSVFVNRYKSALEQLKHRGHNSNDPKITSELNDHLKDEWGHFLDGTYGLCTKSGLPEDIAAKELSILEINELSSLEELSLKQMEKLKAAVNLLDSASSLFAPHERLKSSRHRLINEIRRKYKLQS